MRPGCPSRVISALLLALAVAQPALTAGLALCSRTPHECTDHACFCRKAAAGVTTRPCHGESDEDAPRLSAACQHGTDPVTVPFARPGLLPPMPVPAATAWRLVPLPADETGADGVHEIESPPPRPADLPRA
jgi:hypothetical protein